jgi:hypothetical protein
MNPLLLSLLTLAPAQAPVAPPPGPPATAPLVYLTVIGPAGMKATFHPGTVGAKTLAAPAEVGVRPGYVYRLELEGIPGLQGKFYPSLELRGAVQMSLAQAARHPVPIVFTEDELKRIALTGAMVTKVFFMEDPAKAPAVQTTPTDPLVIEVPPGTDPLDEARARGRPMVVVRVGEREPPREELAQFALPNTILFPGEPRLALPPAPPMVPWMHWPMYDPLIGAKRGAEECLPDGGDVGPRIGFAPDGKLGGLNPSDSAVEYTTEAGKRKIAVSNRICVLVPRYAVARQEIAPAGVASSLAASGFKNAKGNLEFRNRIPTGRADTSVQLQAMTGRQGPSGMQNKMALHGYDQIKGVKIIGSVAGTKVVGKVQEPDEITAYPFCEPISLFKWAEPKEAQVGDVVTFYLRYHNHTKQFVEHLVVSDSLTARLEYVAGSGRSDREATLTIQANEVGSVILRWEVSGKLPPGEHGVVAFQARVR